MKLKKLIERFLTGKTVIVIKVLEPETGHMKKVAETPVYATFKEYPELMSYKVLQIDPSGGEIAIIVTKSKKNNAPL